MFFGSSWSQTMSLRFGITLDQLADLVACEGVEELDSGDRDLCGLLALLVAVDVVIDLARAEDELRDLVLAPSSPRIVQDELERAAR